jgi:hypothetical protein
MNEKIAKYIEIRKQEIALEKENEKMRVLAELGIFEKKYSGSSKTSEEFPFYDPAEMRSYKIIIDGEEISEEDYEELLKYVPKEEQEMDGFECDGKTYSSIKITSSWFQYAKTMIVVGAIGVGITLLSWMFFDTGWLPFVIALSSYIVELGFFGIIQLLAIIANNTRK